MTIRVLLVDDQSMVRAGLRMLLSNEPDIEVVAEAENGLEAVGKAARLGPDVVLMDIHMPVLNGVGATRRILAADELARVLILTTFDLDEYVYEALRAGASGFVLKDDPPEQLIAAVRTVAVGDALLSPHRDPTRDRTVHPRPTPAPAEGGGHPHHPGAGRVPPDRPRPFERRDRPRALHQRHHGEDARHTPASKTSPARPRPGHRSRLPDRSLRGRRAAGMTGREGTPALRSSRAGVRCARGRAGRVHLPPAGRRG